MLSDTEVEQLIREYLSKVIHLSLSTAHDNKPWTSEVHFAYDNALNLYFASEPTRRHSEEIAANSNVSGAITKQHGPDDAPQGIYFEGTTQITDDPSAQATYIARFPKAAQWLPEALKNPDGARVYKISVSDYYVFDAVRSKPSQKYHLSWGK